MIYCLVRLSQNETKTGVLAHLTETIFVLQINSLSLVYSTAIK